MAENFGQANLETEIAELSKQIEAKRRLLESERGVVVEDKEAVAAVVKEELFPSQAPGAAGTPAAPAPAAKPAAVASTDYLDLVDEETAESVNALISQIPEQGFRKTAALAESMSPYYLDIFHDVLTTRLYDELKNRGYLK